MARNAALKILLKYETEQSYLNITLNEYLENSIKYGSGIRILNQDLWETIISFIISANNNIPRIKGIINRLSYKYGNKIEWKGKEYYTFPTVEELSKAMVEDLRKAGLGFRDVRVFDTTKKILEKQEELKEKNLLDLSKEYEESYKIIIDIFDEMIKIFDSETMTIDTYQKIIKIFVG